MKEYTEKQEKILEKQEKKYNLKLKIEALEAKYKHLKEKEHSTRLGWYEINDILEIAGIYELAKDDPAGMYNFERGIRLSHYQSGLLEILREHIDNLKEELEDE